MYREKYVRNGFRSRDWSYCNVGEVVINKKIKKRIKIGIWHHSLKVSRLQAFSYIFLNLPHIFSKPLKSFGFSKGYPVPKSQAIFAIAKSISVFLFAA